MRRNLFRTMMVSLFECPVMRYPARSPIGIFADDRCPMKQRTSIPVVQREGD